MALPRAELDEVSRGGLSSLSSRGEMEARGEPNALGRNYKRRTIAGAISSPLQRNRSTAWLIEEQALAVRLLVDVSLFRLRSALEEFTPRCVVERDANASLLSSRKRDALAPRTTTGVPRCD